MTEQVFWAVVAVFAGPVVLAALVLFLRCLWAGFKHGWKEIT